MKSTELPFIRDMFEAIAPRYDLLNRLLSLKQDVYWRKKMITAMKIPSDGMILDAACGTADVGMESVRQKGKNIRVFGMDFAMSMLLIAKKKTNHASDRIRLLAGNAFDLPFKPDTFDAVTIAFGIRNIGDKVSVLKAFHDVLKPGGMLLVLELTTPRKYWLRSLYFLYFQRILPLIGWFFSKNLQAYQYLPASVMDFPSPPEFSYLMRISGFTDIKWKPLTFGIATLFVGQKS